MSGGGSQKTTTTQKLSGQQKELLQGVIPVAQSYISPDGTVNASTYPGSTVAPINANQVAGQNLALGAAMGPAASTASSTAQGLDFLTSGAALDPSSNPYLTGAINAAVRPITENYTNTVLGNIRSNATLAGQYGYNRQGLEENAAARDYMRQTGDTSAKIAEDAYNTGIDAMSRSLAFAPGVQQMQFAPALAVAGVGQQQQALEQQQIDAAVQQYYQQQFLPLSVAEEIASIAFGIPAGSVSSTTSGGGTSTLQSILGLGTAGLSLGSAAAGAAPSIAPLLALIGL